MYFPTERVYREIRSEEAGLWVVPANGGKETAVLVKAPTNTLKAIISGAGVCLVFATRANYLCSGVRVYDVPGAPLLLSSIQRHEEEHAALRKISEVGTALFFLFNELDVCVAWANSNIVESDRHSLVVFLSKSPDLYSGDFTQDASEALDYFCTAADQMTHIVDANEVLAVEIPVNHGPWTSNMISFAGNNDIETIVLSDSDEGGTLERAVWASLESVFPFSLHKSPQVLIGKKQRELIDVVAFHQYGSFFIEAKDLSVFAAGMDRTRERRVSGVQKQAIKAIGQLVGASKTAKRGERVFDTKDATIPLVLDKPLHCIVLLSELIHEGDWTDVENSLCNAAAETGDYFHVLDFRELVMILKISGGKAHRLDYNLMQRFERFIEAGTIHIRSRLAPN